jgi:alkaline phosphatase
MNTTTCSRRGILRLPFAPLLGAAARPVRFGVVTDVHHADRDPRLTRFYRTARGRLETAVAAFKESRVDFAIELGDFIDEAPQLEREKAYLTEINTVFRRLPCPVHYVLGNHCVFNLTKSEFLAGIGRQQSFYGFNTNGVRFIVLDACCRQDGVDYGRQNYDWTDTFIPEKQTAWLAGELRRGKGPVVVFVHQRLDRKDQYGVKNSPRIRELLEKSGRVHVVFQGHSHENDRRDINGITYLTMCATVERPDPEGGAHAIVEIAPTGSLRVEGFRRQSSYQLARPPKAG